MAMIDSKILSWTNPVSAEADQPVRTASAIKAVFDSNSNQLKTALNAVIDTLTGSGGSAEIGSAAISDVDAGTLLSQLTALRALIDQRVKNITVGTVITGAAGSFAAVNVSGTMPDVVLNFTIPKGDAGNPALPHAFQHASDGNDPIVPSSIGAAAVDHAHTGTYEPARLQFDSVLVDVDDFEADATYADYSYRVDLALAGVTASMVPEVIFAPAEAASGIFAPIAACGSGAVSIYAAAIPEADFTIPTILVWR